MSAPRATRASGQREKLGNLLLEDVPDKCMDVDAIGIRAWSAFGISESSRSQVCKTNSLDNDNATQPSGNFTAFVRDGRNTSERLRTPCNSDIRVLTILAVLLGNQVEAIRFR